METHYFEFEFIHLGKTIPANCYVYTKKRGNRDAI